MLCEHMKVLENLIRARVRGRIRLLIERANVGDVLCLLPFAFRQVVEPVGVQMLTQELNRCLSFVVVDLICTKKTEILINVKGKKIKIQLLGLNASHR